MRGNAPKMNIFLTHSWQATLDLGSGLGVAPPSTLLFILLFISGLDAIPRQNEGLN